MNLNRPDMTETVKSENYTNKFLQKDSATTTMEMVTQTNAVKSPTDSPATTKLVYTVGHPCQKPCSRGQPQEVHTGAYHLDGRGDAGGSRQYG